MHNRINTNETYTATLTIVGPSCHHQAEKRYGQPIFVRPCLWRLASPENIRQAKDFQPGQLFLRPGQKLFGKPNIIQLAEFCSASQRFSARPIISLARSKGVRQAKHCSAS
mgnify:CR=1 FL=1